MTTCGLEVFEFLLKLAVAVVLIVALLKIVFSLERWAR